jgi:hypothetical protein
MAHNEDSNPGDDDQYSALGVTYQLIALDHHCSSNDGDPAHMRYTRHCFI